MQTKKKIGLVVLSFTLILTILNFAPQVDTITAIPNATLQNEVSLSATPSTPPPSMIAYWELNEGAGTTVTDSIVPYVTGHTFGNPMWSPGVAQSGLEIMEGQFIDFGRPSYLYLPEVLTIEAWVNLPDTGGLHTIIMNAYNPTNIQYHFGVQDGRLYFDRQAGAPGNEVTSMASITPGQWHHVAVVMNWGLRRVWFYLDGVDEEIYPYNDGYTGPSGEVTIGADRITGAPSFLNGLIDEVAIYNDMLDQSIIQEHYQKGLRGLGYLDEMTVNEAPVADAGGPYFADEGSSTIFDAFGSADIDGDQLQFRWDFDNDGSWDTDWSTDPSASYTWDDDYSGAVTLEVTDGEFYDTATTTVTVLNVAPLVNAGNDQTVNEGETISFTGGFYDSGLSDTHTVVWDFGDGSPMVSGTLTPTHTYSDDGVYTVTLTVTDDDGGAGTDTLMVTVNNVAPTVDAGPDQTTGMGYIVGFSGSFIDPGTSDTHTIHWDFGDGSFPVSGTLTPTHTYSNDGVYTVTLTVTDDDGGVSSDTLTVIVSNVAPVAVDDEYFIDEDGVLTVPAPGLLDNDYDVDGDPIYVDDWNEPGVGYLMVNPDGSFEFIPDPDWYGVAEFAYWVYDGLDHSNVVTVTIHVFPVNDVPITNDDSYSTDEDTSLNVPAPGVLNNDIDVDGDSLTAVLVMGPDHGLLMFYPDGSFEYVPNPDYFGIDTFTYVVHDGEIGSNVATVSITVVSVNDAPVAVDDAYSIDEDGELYIGAPGVLANDMDVEGDPLQAILLSMPDTHEPGDTGWALWSDGAFYYVPKPDWHGTTSFTYQVFDGIAYSNIATVTITVNPVNNAPVAFDDEYFIDEDGELYIGAPGVLANDMDVEGDPLQAILLSMPDTHELGDTGWAFWSDGAFYYAPKLDWHGTTSFTYQVYDGIAYSNIATVTITVIPVNDAPVSYPFAIIGNEDNVLFNILPSGSDVEGDPLEYIIAENPAHGVLVLDSITGAFSYSPDLDWFGFDSFYYQVYDGELYSNIATVTIEVIEDDDTTGPEITIIYTGGYTDDNPGYWDVIVADPESGVDSITVEVDGIVVGTFEGTYLVPNTLGDHTITVTATNADSNNGPNDQETSTVSATVTILDDDVTGPEIDITYFGDMTDTNPGIWTVIVTDPESGVYSILVEIDGVPVGTTEDDYPVPSTGGFHSITVTAMNSDMDRPNDQETTTHSAVVLIEASTLPTELIYSGDLEGQYSDPVYLEALLFDTTNGVPIPGKWIHFYLGAQYAWALTDVDGLASINLVLDQEAGVYELLVTFDGDDEYLAASSTNEFVIHKECATILYSGTTIIEASKESITLQATVFDDADGHLGNLSLAYMTITIFLSSDTVTPFYTSSPVRVQTTGLVILEIPNLPEGEYLIVASLLPEHNRFYCNPDAETATITIYEPERAHAHGAGFIVDADGHRGFFVFKAKYTCGGNLKGFLVYTYVEGDWVYFVKSCDIMGFDTDDNHGFFEANSTISQYNFRTHEKVRSEDRYRVRIDVFDNKRSHEKDVFQIRVFDSLGQVEYEAGFDPFGYLLRGCIVVKHGRRH